MIVHGLARCSPAAFLVLTVTGLLFFPTRWVGAQPAPLGPVIGIEEPSSENSRTPFELHMTGMLNPAREHNAEPQAEAEGATTEATSAWAEQTYVKKGIAVVTFCITKFRATYQFTILQLEAPGYTQLSPSQILQKVGKRKCDFDVIGSSALLSKVAQAPPGTPLTIVGMYVQYDQRFQLVSVDVADRGQGSD